MNRKDAATALVLGALSTLVAVSCWQRWTSLAASPFPLGVDGYFYPVQLRALLETGGLQYPAAPLTFWLMAPFAAATDPITGAKLAAAVLGALVALPAYGVGARLGGGRGAGLVAAALATSSAGSAYLTHEFVKNAVGLGVALLAVWLVLRALEAPSRRRLVGALAAIGAALLAHKMAAALVGVLCVPAWLATLGGRGTLRGRRLFYAIGAVGAGVVALLVLGLVYPERFLSTDDARLIAELWSSTPHWTAPALVTPRGTLVVGHEALAGALFAVVAMAVGMRLSPASAIAAMPAGDRAAARATLALALLIGLPWLAVVDEQALGFRLRIAAFVPMALAAAILCGRLLPRVAHRDAILAALALVLATRRPDVPGRVVTHPALVTAVQALDAVVPGSDTVIVSERHILYMVAWYARARVALRPDAAPPDRRWRLMPLAFIEAGSPLDELLMQARDVPGLVPPRGLHPRHPNGLVLVAEATWQWILARLPPNVPARWRDWQTI